MPKTTAHAAELEALPTETLALLRDFLVVSSDSASGDGVATRLATSVELKIALGPRRQS